MSKDTLIVRWLGMQPYLVSWQAMRTFTDQRHEQTCDEIWLLEHPPVYTQGQNGQSEHLLNPGNIPVIASDRGGQITYHGPGQLIAYTLVDIKRKKMGIRSFVSALEMAIINLLAAQKINAHTTCHAPGVYVGDKKICSLGLRVRRGSAYHGLALNVNMDLNPFNNINPCGFKNLAMTQMIDFNPTLTLSDLRPQLAMSLMKNLVYRDYNYILDSIVPRST